MMTKGKLLLNTYRAASIAFLHHAIYKNEEGTYHYLFEDHLKNFLCDIAEIGADNFPLDLKHAMIQDVANESSLLCLSTEDAMEKIGNELILNVGSEALLPLYLEVFEEAHRIDKLQREELYAMGEFDDDFYNQERSYL